MHVPVLGLLREAVRSLANMWRAGCTGRHVRWQTVAQAQEGHYVFRCLPGVCCVVQSGCFGALFLHRNRHMTIAENHLIQQLPAAVRRRFLLRCEPFDLLLSAELSARDHTLTHAYFPRSGFISLVIDVDSHPPLEVGMVGCESMLGSELVLGLAKTPWRALVQGPGRCWRIGADALRESLAEMNELQEVVRVSLMVRLHQQALASACERFHMIGPRLARWLLMSQDRACSDTFRVTQEFIALMLGVRRVGVTQAAGAFQDSGIIQYHRGKVTVLDRTALEAEACSCYEADKQILAELTVRRR